MSLQPVLILGATSAIARGAATALARRGYPLLLAGRDAEELDRDATHLQIKYGITATPLLFDADACSSHPALLQQALTLGGGRLAGVVLAFGYLGDQRTASRSWPEAEAMIHRNFTAAVSILNLVAEQLQQQQSGFIAAISSVAGDRGRQSNYIYGAAKGGLSIYLQGLRNRLFKQGVTVVTVKPGFVDTAMTFGMEGLFLVATPQAVGESIIRAVEKRCNTLYTPWFWQGIMLIIRTIPETIFKRLSL